MKQSSTNSTELMFEFYYDRNTGVMFSIDANLNTGECSVWLSYNRSEYGEEEFELNTWSLDEFIDDLTELSEEEFFQYSLVKNNITIESYVFSLEFILAIQRKLKSEFSHFVVRDGTNEPSYSTQRLITIEY